MITKEQAAVLKPGMILHHVRLKDSDGQPIRCRVTGACKTWRQRHGFYLEPHNALF